MTEYEIIDAMVSLSSETAQHSMNLVYVIFSCVVVAYLVGRKLSRLQVAIITIIYFIWSLGPIMAAYDSGTALQQMYRNNQQILSIEMGASPLKSYVPIIVGVGMSFAWIMSILFMLQLRISK
jgi:hypothetical protein